MFKELKITDICIAIAAIVALAISTWQGIEARQATEATKETVIAMKESNADGRKRDEANAKDTAASIELTKQAANAAAESVGLAQQANATAVETAATLKKTADANALSASMSQQAIEWYKKANENAARTANAMADSVAKNQQHHEMQMRAFLTVDETKLEKSQPPKANQPSQFLVASISVANTGLSPAHHVFSTCNVICEAPDFQGPFNDDGDGAAPAPPPLTSLNTAVHLVSQNVQHLPEMSIGPSEGIQKQAKFPMNSAAWNLWNSKKAIAWVFGRVCYTDVFGHEHHTSYRFKQGNDLKTGAMILTLADDGNDSD